MGKLRIRFSKCGKYTTVQVFDEDGKRLFVRTCINRTTAQDLLIEEGYLCGRPSAAARDTIRHAA